MPAVYHREWPTREGKDYTLLDAPGRGVYLGQIMTVEPLRPEIKRWWEGDLRFPASITRGLNRLEVEIRWNELHDELWGQR